MSNANERQVGGSHYGLRKYQHWDFTIKHLDNRYLEGAVTKYLLRWRDKDGLRDLEKCEHFIEKLIESVNSGLVVPMANASLKLPAVVEFCDVVGVPVGRERDAMLFVCTWRSLRDLNAARSLVGAVAADERQRLRDLEATKAGARPPVQNGPASQA